MQRGRSNRDGRAQDAFKTKGLLTTNTKKTSRRHVKFTVVLLAFLKFTHKVLGVPRRYRADSHIFAGVTMFSFMLCTLPSRVSEPISGFPAFAKRYTECSTRSHDGKIEKRETTPREPNILNLVFYTLPENGLSDVRNRRCRIATVQYVCELNDPSR